MPRPTTSCVFLGVQWFGAHQDTPFKVNNKLLHLSPLPLTTTASSLWAPHAKGLEGKESSYYTNGGKRP